MYHKSFNYMQFLLRPLKRWKDFIMWCP